MLFYGLPEKTLMLTSCPGTVDQKNPRQSGSSNMYGTNRVNSRTQFKTENKHNQLQYLKSLP